MSAFLERFRSRLFERQEEAEDMREMLALLERQMKAAQEMTADRDRLYGLIDQKVGYVAEINRLRERVAKLEEAFRVYGFHHYDCETVVGLSCTCGLTDLLEKPLSSERSAGHA